MVKPELGTKRSCPSCQTRFYDLGKEPIVCPKCGVTFRFITSRLAGPLDRNRGATVKRIKDRRPDLTFIDYQDYKEITGKQQAREFFK